MSDGGGRSPADAREVRLLACCFVLLLVPASTSAEVDRRPDMAQGEVVVQFRSGVAPSGRADARRDADVVAERAMLRSGAQVVRAEDGDAVAAARALEDDPRVRYAEPNRVRRPLAVTPDDARWSALYGLRTINAPAAWETTQSEPDVVVAVIDEGVAYDHPDLAPGMWANQAEVSGAAGVDDDGNGVVDDVRGWDFYDADADPRDIGGHGTHVAGTVAARAGSGIGVVGVAPRASIMALRALGPGGGTDADIADAMTYAGRNGAKIVNGSFGGPGFSQAMADAIAGAPRTLFVVAAGNDGEDVDAQAVQDFPCAFTHVNVVCVAATNSSDGLASFSNTGARSVDVAAPGVGIVSDAPGVHRQALDDFESSDLTPNWTTTWGRLARSGGGFSLADSPTGNYAASADTRATWNAPLDLRDRVGCVLEYDLMLQTQRGYDYVDVETSWDGGAWTWRDGYSGSTNGTWYDWESPLESDGRASVRFRFRLRSNAGVEYQGVSIDDLALRCVGTTYDEGSYATMSGTSMATPHVAGAAALAWAVRPSATVADVRAALLDTGVPLPVLGGRTVTGRRLDAAATVAAMKAVPPAAGQPASDPPPGDPPASDPPPGDPPAPAPPVTAPPVTAPPPSVPGPAVPGPGKADDEEPRAGTPARPIADPFPLPPKRPPVDKVVEVPEDDEEVEPVLGCEAKRANGRLRCTLTPPPAKTLKVRLRKGRKTLATGRMRGGRVVLSRLARLRPGIYRVELLTPAGIVRKRIRL